MNSFSRSQGLVVLLMSLLLLSVYGWSHYTQHRKSRKPPQLPTKYVFIQVAGKVKSPGIYSFSKAVTIAQVVARAGGLLSPLVPLDESAWSQSQIGNGRRIQIIIEPSGFAGYRREWMAVSIRLALGVPLDVNQASVAELAQVPGVNDKLAERIVTLRGSRGGFSKLESLCEVKGIGPATVRRLQLYLTVGSGGD
jgi:competence ComEA-like helix-hairpin-helix protein